MKEVHKAGAEGPAWTRFFVDDAISMKVQHKAGGGRCLALTTGLASPHADRRGETEEGGEQVLAKKMTDGDLEQVLLGLLVDTN